MLISIIMNIKDGERYLRETLESVMAQTYSDWELIVWDDRSSDRSAAIVAEYPDSRIRYYLSDQHTGLGRARHLAMQQAKGEWLAFLDQDDVWLPDKLTKQVELIGKYSPLEKLGIVYGRTMVIMPDGREWDFDSFHEFQPLPEGDILQDLLLHSCFINMSSGMLLRQAAEEISDIPEEFSLACDYYLFLHVAQQYRARAVNHVVCYYRVHDDSLSHLYREPMIRQASRLIEQYRPAMTSRAMKRSRKLHDTMMVVGQLRSRGTFLRGLKGAIAYGCMGYILSRPAVHLYRAVRREYWPAAWAVVPRPRIAGIHPRQRTVEKPELKLSIIVVNWNVRDLLRDCLDSVYREMRLPANEWELIVVDNNSPDSSVEMLRREFPQVTLIANSENLGFAKANNQAFHSARGRYVLLLNPDTLVVDEAIDGMIERMEADPKIGILGCRLLNPDGTTQKWTAGNSPRPLNAICHFLFLYHLLPASMLPAPIIMEEEPRTTSTTGWVSGACMLLRREALQQRLFDERFFMYGEDLELCMRVGSTHWNVVYAPDLHIIHYGGRSTDAQAPEIQLKRLQSLRDVFIIHNGKRWLWGFDIAAFVGFSLRSMIYSLAARLRPGKGFEIRAERSRVLMTDAARTLING